MYRMFERSMVNLPKMIRSISSNAHGIPVFNRQITDTAESSQTNPKYTESGLTDMEQSDIFGTLDPKFLDSKSLKQIRDKNGSVASVSQRLRHSNDHERIVDDSSKEKFGLLWSKEEFEKEFSDLVEDEVDLEFDGEDDKHIRLSKYDRKHSQPWYDHRLIKLSRRGQVIEAVRLLKEEMINKDRVMPTRVSYTVVISALAKAGYTSLAFKLFYEMLERGIKAPKHVFSALFNACANCPDKRKGLNQAHYLRDYMRVKNSPRNFINYKAQIKAFALTGDIRTAFATLDEAIDDGNQLDLEACSMLLMACISDKQNGFLHAIKVWRLMVEHGLKPDIYQYNLLTRAVLESGVQDIQSLNQLITGAKHSMTTDGNGRRRLTHETRPPTNYIAENFKGENGDVTSLKENDVTSNRGCSGEVKVTASVNSRITIPDILSPKSRCKDLISVTTVTSATDRLTLLGGVTGLLARMRRDRVKADVKTFSMLLDCVNNDVESEMKLLDLMTDNKVEMDTAFCNLLMRRRVFRQDQDGAKAVLELMGIHQLTPDLHTFATLGLICKTKDMANTLIEDMKALDMSPTNEIFSHLNQAAFMNFNYRKWLCEEMERRSVVPDHRFIQQCETRIQQARKMILDWDRNNKADTRREQNFRHKFKNFNLFYKAWLLRNKVKPSAKEPKRFRELEWTDEKRLDFDTEADVNNSYYGRR